MQFVLWIRSNKNILFLPLPESKMKYNKSALPTQYQLISATVRPSICQYSIVRACLIWQSDIS